MKIFIDAGDSCLSLERAAAIIDKYIAEKDEVILLDDPGANQVLKAQLFSKKCNIHLIKKTDVTALDFALCGYWMRKSKKVLILLNLTSPPIASINIMFDLALRYAGQDKMECIFI